MSLFRPFVSLLMTVVNYVVRASVHWWGQTQHLDALYANNQHAPPPSLGLGTTLKTDVSLWQWHQQRISQRFLSRRSTIARYPKSGWPTSGAFWWFCVLRRVLRKKQRLSGDLKTSNFTRTHWHGSTNYKTNRWDVFIFLNALLCTVCYTKSFLQVVETRLQVSDMITLQASGCPANRV